MLWAGLYCSCPTKRIQETSLNRATLGPVKSDLLYIRMVQFVSLQIQSTSDNKSLVYKTHRLRIP